MELFLAAILQSMTEMLSFPISIIAVFWKQWRKPLLCPAGHTVLVIIYLEKGFKHSDTCHLYKLTHKILKQSLLLDKAPCDCCLHVTPHYYSGAMMRRLICDSQTAKSIHTAARPHKAALHNIQADRQYHPLTACTAKHTNSETLLIIHHVGKKNSKTQKQDIF